MTTSRKVLCLVPLIFAACASRPTYQIQPDGAGVYRFQGVSRPEYALRSADGKIVTNADDAQKTLQALKQPIDPNEISRIPDCTRVQFYKAKAAQLQAETFLKKQSWSDAKSALTEAEKQCPQIGLITAQDYDSAMASEGLGEHEKARGSAARFLNDSAAVDPWIYQQGDGPGFKEDEARDNRASDLYKEYRKKAQAFLQEGAPLSLPQSTEEVAKFYPNDFYRPGGNRRAGFVILPSFSYDNLLGLSAGAFSYYSAGKTGFGAYYMNSETTGSFFGVKIRESLYESPNRDFDLDGFIAGKTQKFVRYEANSQYYDAQGKVTVLNSSFDPGLGVGFTHRPWLPTFGYSGELAVFNNPLDGITDFESSLFGFYDLFGDISLEAGWIQNRPMIGLKILFFRVGYNLRDSSLNVLITGLAF